MTDPSQAAEDPHPAELPQPIELPLEERGSAAPLGTQLVRFVVTGGLSAVVDFGTLLALTHLLGFSQPAGKAVSFVLGTTTAYLINRRWTFRAEPSKRRFAAVVALYALTFALQVGLYSLTFPLVLRALRHGAEVPTQVICFVFAQGVATAVNFVVQRFVIFRLI